MTLQEAVWLICETQWGHTLIRETSQNRGVFSQVYCMYVTIQEAVCTVDTQLESEFLFLTSTPQQNK